MFRSYFKTALRSLLKNRIFSIINLLGLAIGIASCLLILQYVTYELSYDTFHEKADRIYRIRYDSYQNGKKSFECAAAVPAVGPEMKNNFPEVLAFARLFPADGIITYESPTKGPIVFREERLHVADAATFDIFNLPFIEGDPKTALEEPFTVVISESIAKKFFADEDPMGKTLDWNGRYEFEVKGIMKDLPNNSHIKIDFLFSYKSINETWGESTENSWGWYDFNTYVLLEEGIDPVIFQAKWDSHLAEVRKESWEKYNYRQEFILQPLKNIHLYSNLLQESEPDEQGDGKVVYFLSIVAVFILIIAWVNYINLSTAKSVERANEVGVRKVMGAFRHQLIGQFLTESFLLNLLAAILAIGIVFIALPYYSNFTGKELSFTLSQEPTFWLVLVGLFLIGSLLSGAYPAFVLSAFKPVTVMKGKGQTSSFGVYLRKSLVVFQFVASIFLITGTLVVYQQINYMLNQDLGVNIDRTVVLKGPGVTDSLYTQNFNTFKTEVLKNAGISKVTAATNVPGDEIFWTNGIRRLVGGPENNTVIYRVGMDYDYLPTFDIEVVAGRNFLRDFPSDEQGIILNVAATKLLEFRNPEEAINEKVRLGGDTLNVVGVIADYQQMSLKSQPAPITFRLIPDADSFYSLKVVSSDFQGTMGDIQAKWSEFFPENPFDYFYLDQFFNRQYEPEIQFGKVLGVFAGLAIFVACLGLFGLAAFIALQRTKEIGVRKVLGASVGNILLLLSKDFSLLVLIGFLIAAPLSYWILDLWLNNFATRISIQWWILVLSGITVFTIAILTVGYQTLKAALVNPVNSLRDE